MNSIILFCIFASVAVTCHAKKTDISALLEHANEFSNCYKMGLQCKDCNMIQYCSDDMKSLLAVECAMKNPETPYCDSETNLCSVEKPAVCEVGDPNFNCPGVGNYPDLLDCKVHYECGENRLSHRLECPDDTIFDYALQSCTTDSVCSSYSSEGLCKGHVNQIVPYQNSRHLYVLCMFGKDPAIMECPKGEYYNEKERKCHFECAKQGVFPHSKKPNKYYFCMQVANTFVESTLECPKGNEFIETGDGTGVCGIRTTTTSTTTTTARTTITELEETSTGMYETTITEDENTTDDSDSASSTDSSNDGSTTDDSNIASSTDSSTDESTTDDSNIASSTDSSTDDSTTDDSNIASSTDSSTDEGTTDDSNIASSTDSSTDEDSSNDESTTENKSSTESNENSSTNTPVDSNESTENPNTNTSEDDRQSTEDSGTSAPIDQSSESTGTDAPKDNQSNENNEDSKSEEDSHEGSGLSNDETASEGFVLKIQGEREYEEEIVENYLGNADK